MSHDKTNIGRIDTTEETSQGLVASGGWCAPSSVLYGMGMLTAEEVAAMPDPEPEPLPDKDVVTEYVEWVVKPTEDYYGVEDTHDTEEAAYAAWLKRVARSTPDEAVWIEQRTVQHRVVWADHGTMEPSTDESEGGFPRVDVARGGIDFRTPPSDEG